MVAEATAYVVEDSKGKQVYFLPRMDMWLTIEHVHNKFFDGTLVDLRSARQSEMRMAEGKPKTKIPSHKTFRCARDTLNVGTEIYDAGYDIDTMSSW